MSLGLSKQEMAGSEEYFYASGVTVINMFDREAFEGCFETTCTMRYERAAWHHRNPLVFLASEGLFRAVGQLFRRPDVVFSCIFPRKEM